MLDLDALIDLHRDADRQGPGGPDATRQAIALSGLVPSAGLRIADIGCGTGASTLILARALRGHVTAVDALQPFLDRLTADAAAAGLAAQITTLQASMETLPFAERSLDLIWAEGSIYNLGFAQGTRLWRRFLVDGGVLAVSDLTWLTTQRPMELEAHWVAAYPEVATAATRFGQLETAGYTPIGYFPLPPECWLDNYYRPMQRRFAAFLARQNNSAAARAIVEAEEHEISLYERHTPFVSYGFYIARAVAP